MSVYSTGVRRSSTLPVRFEPADNEGGVLPNPNIAAQGVQRPPSPARKSSIVDIDELLKNVPPRKKDRRRRRRGHGRSRSRSRSSSNGNSGSSDRSSSASSSSFSPIRGRRRIRYNYGSDDSDTDDQTYSFTLTRRTASVFSQESTIAASSIREKLEENGPALAVGAKRPDTAYNILRSKYSGEGNVGGEHRTDLTVVEDLRKQKSSLYRWIHFHDQNMNFDNFKNSVASISGISDAERTSILKLLGRVRRNFDKPYQTSKGSGARVMEPGHDQETVQPSSSLQQKQSKLQTVTWLCLPYFSLDRYVAEGPNGGRGSHPLRSLLQTHSSSVGKPRDMQQAVCQLPGSESDFCYHVSQVWYLVIGDSVLISCARVPIQSLQSKSIAVTSAPSPASSSAEGQKILVYYGASLLWSFALNDCETWFALMSKFAEFWPDKVRLLYSDKDLTPEMWPRLVNRAKHTNETIRLRLQRTDGDKPRLKGVLPSRGDFLAGEKDNTDQIRQVDIDDNDDAQKLTSSTDQKADATPAGTLSSSIYFDNFFVFPWLSTRLEGSVSHDQVDQDLQAMDVFLSQHTDLADSVAYKRCRSLKWEDVYKPLRQQADDLMATSSKTESKSERKKRTLHECKVDVFNAAEALFEFFLPLSTLGPTVDKFWGALGTLLEAVGKDESSKSKSSGRSRRRGRHGSRYDENDLIDICEELESLLQIFGPFKKLLSHTTMADRDTLSVPDELVKSWLHIIMALVYAANQSYSWRGQLESAESLIRVGTKNVMKAMTKKSLLEESVVMPQEIATLVNFGLLHDTSSSKDAQRDITQTYWEYVNKLQSDIEANPLYRGHQDSILRLKQEIAIVLETLLAQEKIFIKMGISANMRQSPRHDIDRMHSYRADRQNYYDERTRMQTIDHRQQSHAQPSYAHALPRTTRAAIATETVPLIQSGLSPTDPGGYRDLLVQDCLEVLRRKIADFGEMNEQASDLETWNIRRIETNKDRQENAIYAFTIVTIIFLPLSTVAGILGMNVSDVRDMDQKQWVFWAVAIPLMVIVIFLCLVWTGELDNFWTGFKFLFRKDRGIGKSAMLSAQRRAAYEYDPWSSPPPPPPPAQYSVGAPLRNDYTENRYLTDEDLRLIGMNRVREPARSVNVRAAEPIVLPRTSRYD